MVWLNKKVLQWRNKPKDNNLSIVNRKNPIWKPLFLMGPAIAILIIFTIIPFIYTINDAFHYKKPSAGLLEKGEWSLRTFSIVANDPNFIKGIKNSIFYALISLPLVIIISMVISAAIANVIRKKVRGIFQTIFFLPFVTSAVAISITFSYLFDFRVGILNKLILKANGTPKNWLIDSQGNMALWAILIFGVWRGLAFNILIFTTAILSVNKTLYKSASIDGAGNFKQFMQITLPSIKKTTNFLVIMGIIGAIKVFPLALFNNNSAKAITNGGTTIMLYVFHMVSNGNVAKAGVASIYLLLISMGYTIIVKSGFNQMARFINWIGEKRVANKIKIQ